VNAVRIAITMFVLVLLTIVVLGWVWTGTHQLPPQRTASRVVLSIAAVSGLFAVTRIWRPDQR
jgi:hypothetical protein